MRPGAQRRREQPFGFAERESDAQEGVLGADKKPARDERRQQAARLARTRADETGQIGARHLAEEAGDFENGGHARVESARGGLGRDERADPCRERLRCEEGAHEPDPIDAGREEEAAELREAAIGQDPASIARKLGRRVGTFEARLVRAHVSGETARHGPWRRADIGTTQQRMRQQPRGAAVPVGERMHEEQTVMQRRDRDDAVRARETPGRALVEALQPVRHLVGRGRDMATDLDMRLGARPTRDGAWVTPADGAW